MPNTQVLMLAEAHSDPSPMPETLGALVFRLRSERGMSQASLASAAGITHDTIAKVEQGRGRRWFPANAKAVLKALASEAPILQADGESFLELCDLSPTLLEGILTDDEIVHQRPRVNTDAVQPPSHSAASLDDVYDAAHELVNATSEEWVLFHLQSLLKVALGFTTTHRDNLDFPTTPAKRQENPGGKPVEPKPGAGRPLDAAPPKSVPAKARRARRPRH